MLAADDPIACAVYAKDHDLLDTPGWTRFKSIARRHKKYIKMVNQAKLWWTTPKYMIGYEIPRDFKHAVELDKRNGNTKWQDCTKLEMQQLFLYDTFQDLGIADRTPIPDGYKRIRVHLVYAVKHDGRHKARLVADGHLTDVPMESVYSGVVPWQNMNGNSQFDWLDEGCLQKGARLNSTCVVASNTTIPLLLDKGIHTDHC